MLIDGELESLLTPSELRVFREEIERFTRWYSLMITRSMSNSKSAGFRTHPQKILDDEVNLDEELKLKLKLKENEVYPEDFFLKIMGNYGLLLRGKSLFAILLRQLSSKKREIKFSSRQLMAIGASRKGENFKKMTNSIKEILEANCV